MRSDAAMNNMLLDVDIDRIKKNHDVSKNVSTYNAILHLPTKDIELDYLVYVDTSSDYNQSVTDSISIQFVVMNGVFHKEIVPDIDNLFITLIKRDGIDKKTNKYKFVIANHTAADIGNMTTNNNKEELDKEGMKVVYGQAINISYYATRLITSSATLTGVSIEKAIIASFNDFFNSTRNISINGKPIKLDTLNLDTPDNPNIYNAIVFPTKVGIYDLATKLQDDYGVYNGHIGTYISNERVNDEWVDVISIYPLYNPEAVKNRKRRLRIYAAKGITTQFLDVSFVDSKNTLDLICSAEASSKQIFSQHSSNSGAGYSMLDANYITKGNSVDSSRKVSNDSKLYNKEAYEKKDGVPFTYNAGISSNTYEQRSNVLRQKGTLISIPWNFSRPELIYPGMTVEYIFEKVENDIPKLKTYNGIVQRVDTRVDVNKKTSSSSIFIFLNNEFSK